MGRGAGSGARPYECSGRRAVSGTATRALTAAVLIPLVVAAVWWGSSALVATLLAVITVMTLREVFATLDPSGSNAGLIWAGLGSVAVVHSQWALAGRLSPGIEPDWWAPWWPELRTLPLELVLTFYLLGVAVILFLPAKNGTERRFLDVATASAVAMLFVALPLSYLVRLHAIEGIGPKLVLFVLAVVWAGDSAAYFAGRSFGRRPLAPAISPRKTWEGAIANLAGSVAVALVFSRWLRLPAPPMYLVNAALLVSVVGQLGDLFESALKRGAGVKDSGSLLPGHGGIWDRIDALIFAAPVVWWYFSLMRF